MQVVILYLCPKNNEMCCLNEFTKRGWLAFYQSAGWLWTQSREGMTTEVTCGKDRVAERALRGAYCPDNSRDLPRTFSSPPGFSWQADLSHCPLVSAACLAFCQLRRWREKRQKENLQMMKNTSSLSIDGDYVEIHGGNRDGNWQALVSSHTTGCPTLHL